MQDKTGDGSAAPAALEFGNPCACPVCGFSRRRKEIEKAPTVEAYADLLRDVVDHWLNESFDDDYTIYKLNEKLDALQASVAVPPPVTPTLTPESP